MRKERENTENIKALFNYISDYSKIKNKIITDFNEYNWKIEINNIPEDEENITINYFDKVKGNENFQEDFVLKVHRPDFTRCPKIPEILKEWIKSGWDDYHNENAEIIFQHYDIDRKTQEKIIEYFDDVPERRVEFDKWNDIRKDWVKDQIRIEKTRNFYSDLWKIYDELKTEGDKEEIILANGIFEVKDAKIDDEDVIINHPILTRRMELKFDSARSTFYLQNTASKSEIYSSLLSKVEGINTDISDLSSELSEKDYHPMDRNDTKMFLKNLIHRITNEGAYVENKNEKEYEVNRFTMLFNPIILVRKRISGVTRIIEEIIKNIEETGYVPEHLQQIACGKDRVPPKDEELTLTEKLAETGGESETILLAKLANKEQLDIAKRIEKYDGVLVQGPPGTGKTHTIANLIGNFLAKNKTVLVTSYTKKALSVLKDKLPEEMQNLCVSVLDDNNHDMEKSIDGITEHIDSTRSGALKIESHHLKEERKKILSELSKTRETICQILNNEYKSIILNGEDISPSDAARFIFENQNELSYIKGPVKAYSTIPLTFDELRTLYSTNEFIDKNEEKELDKDLPNPNELIGPDDFEIKVNSINSLKYEIDKIAENNNWKIVLGNNISFKIESVELKIDSLDESNLNSLKEFLSKYEHVDKWARAICVDSKKGNNRIKKWEDLLKLIDETKKINDEIQSSFYSKNLTINIETLRSFEQTIIDIKGEILRKNKLPKIGLFTNKNLKTFLGLKVVDNRTIQNLDDCNFLLLQIKLNDSRKKLENLWNKFMVKGETPKFFELDDEEPETVAFNRYGKFFYDYMYWFQNAYSDLNKLLYKCSISKNILKVNPFNSEENQVNNIFDALEFILPKVVDACLCKLKIDDIDKEIKQYIKILQDKKLINSYLCIEMKEELKNYDFENYSKTYQKFIFIYSKTDKLKERNELLDKLEDFAPSWRDDIRNRNGIHGKNTVPENIYDAWKFAQLNQILNDLNNQNLDDLMKQNTELSAKLRKKTEEYAVSLAWYNTTLKIESNTQVLQELKGWKQLTKMIGKGTGKNASMYREKARASMSKCQKAVPCWIMPISKAFETLNPKENLFDVVIIDEASQSDITNLPIFYMGKKIIVVGDDKQVSPDVIGLDLEKINHLQEMKIKGKIKNYELYTNGKSIYEIADTTFPSLMLKEHFRCVPDIIGFSNMLSYDSKILPLRDYGSSNLVPAFINYKVDGRRSEYNKTNIVEAQNIIALLKACLNNKEYDGKTFGIISLLGDEQVKVIKDLLFKYVDQNDIEERNITVGNSANFQGDERDVIFISLVDSSKEYYDGPLSRKGEGNNDIFKKRYNVAVSRAKDQIWIVNSLDQTNDLKEGDLRKKLLDYADNPRSFEFKKEEIKGKSESVFEEQVALKLTSEGYHIVQQYKVGSFRIDIVAIYGDKKIAIECDGDQFHSSDEQVFNDVQRQQILERSGWKFIRIKGSDYFRNPDLEMKNVFSKLNKLGIEKESSDTINEYKKTSPLFESVKTEAQVYLQDITQGKEINNKPRGEYVRVEPKPKKTFNDETKPVKTPKNEDGVLIKKPDPINNDYDTDFFTSIIKSNKTNLTDEQFEFMVLYSEYKTYKDISEYFNYSLDHAKEILKQVKKIRNAKTNFDCYYDFKEEFESTFTYDDILNQYREDNYEGQKKKRTKSFSFNDEDKTRLKIITLYQNKKSKQNNISKEYILCKKTNHRLNREQFEFMILYSYDEPLSVISKYFGYDVNYAKTILYEVKKIYKEMRSSDCAFEFQNDFDSIKVYDKIYDQYFDDTFDGKTRTKIIPFICTGVREENKFEVYTDKKVENNKIEVKKPEKTKSIVKPKHSLTEVQFKFMTLYSYSVSIEDISKYCSYKVDYAKEILKNVMKIYNTQTELYCIRAFDEEHKTSNKYLNIVNEYEDYLLSDDETDEPLVDETEVDFKKIIEDADTSNEYKEQDELSFDFMVLYSNYIPINDISQYFEYNEDYVEECLESYKEIYNKEKLEDCRNQFTKDNEFSLNYIRIINKYTEYILNNPSYKFYGNSGYLLSHKFISSLRGYSIPFIDDRKNNNVIWIEYSESYKDEVDYLIKHFKFEAEVLPKGSKETDFKPAYKVILNKFREY